jgi:hypothetical protein
VFKSSTGSYPAPGEGSGPGGISARAASICFRPNAPSRRAAGQWRDPDSKRAEDRQTRQLSVPAVPIVPDGRPCRQLGPSGRYQTGTAIRNREPPDFVSRPPHGSSRGSAERLVLGKLDPPSAAVPLLARLLDSRRDYSSIQPLADLSSSKFTRGVLGWDIDWRAATNVVADDVPGFQTVRLVDIPVHGVPVWPDWTLDFVAARDSLDEALIRLDARVGLPSVWLDGRSDASALLERYSERVRKEFADLTREGLFSFDPTHGEQRHWRAGMWISWVTFSAHLRVDDPRTLVEVFQPALDHFHALVRAPECFVFLCHASEDKDFVDDLAAFLDRHDLATWYDKREIAFGESIVSKISDGLERASHLVVVLSREAVAKPWVQRELSAALMRQLDDASVTVLPLLREDCRLPALLRDIRYLDCRERQQEAFAELVEFLKRSPSSGPKQA